MGSIFQSVGLEQSDPKKPNTGNVSDRDSTVAHLLVASGYANAPIDQASVAAYASTTDTKPFLFKSATDANNITPIKAAESVPIGFQPPLMRSALTSNLLSAEPTVLKAQVAPEDPNCRNMSQCDVAHPRVNSGQPEVPVLRLLKEPGAVAVASQSADVIVNGVPPKAEPATLPAPRTAAVEASMNNPGRMETQSPAPRQDAALPAVPTNRLPTTDAPVQQLQHMNGSELKPVASIVPDTRTNPVTVHTDGVVPVQVRSADTSIGTQTRSAVDAVVGTQNRTVDAVIGTQNRTGDTSLGTPIRGGAEAPVGAQNRNIDPYTSVGIRGGADAPVGPSRIPVQNDIGSGAPAPVVRHDSQSPGPQLTNRAETPSTVSGKFDAPATTLTGAPVKLDAPAQPRIEVSNVAPQNVAPAPRTNDGPTGTTKDTSTQRDLPQLQPTTRALSNVMQAVSSNAISSDIVKSAAVGWTEQLNRFNYSDQVHAAPAPPADRSLPSAAPSTTNNSERISSPAPTNCDAPPARPNTTVALPERPNTTIPLAERPSNTIAPPERTNITIPLAERPNNTVDKPSNTGVLPDKPGPADRSNNAALPDRLVNVIADRAANISLDRPGNPAAQPDKPGSAAADKPGIIGGMIPDKPGNVAIEKPGNTDRTGTISGALPDKPGNISIEKPGNTDRTGTISGALPDKPGNIAIEKPANTNTVPERPGNNVPDKPGTIGDKPGTSNPLHSAPGVVPERGQQDKPTSGNLPEATRAAETSGARSTPGDLRSSDNKPTVQGDLTSPQRLNQEGRSELPRTNNEGRTPDGQRSGLDSRVQDPSKANVDGRALDPSKPGQESRSQDTPRMGPEGRIQEGQRANPSETSGRLDPNRTINQDGMPKASEPKNAEGPRGELGRGEQGRTAVNEGRTADGGKGSVDGLVRNSEGRANLDSKSVDGVSRSAESRSTESRSTESRSTEPRSAELRSPESRAEARNLDGSGMRNQESARINDGLNTRPTESTGRTHEGGRNSEQNIASKSFDGAQVRNQDNIPANRSEGQPAKVDAVRSDAPSKLDAVRSDFASNRTAPESTSTRPENATNRTAEPRPDNVANRISEPRSENATNRTPESIANKSTENVSIRANESSRTSDQSSIKTGDIRTDVSANRVSETPINKNEASNLRGEIASNRLPETAANKTDGIVNRPVDLPNARSNDAPGPVDFKSFDPSTSKQTDLTNVRADASKTPDAGDSRTPDRVGLNVDGTRQTQFVVPADMVATQKEAAAIRQVLNELKQNQNLSASEVLELPAFKEAMRLLDALKPKDGEVDQDGKQHFTTSFVEAMRLSDFLKVLEKANQVEQKKIHKQQWAARSLAQSQHRVRYLVQKDDTLESVAEKILGDIRFVQLLVTINRAEIIFTVVNGKSVSTIYEGQYLWIPTPNEVSIHRKHYFNANSATVRCEPIAPEAETPIMVEEYEAPTTVRDFATRLRSVTAPPVGAPGGPVSSPMAVVLYRLRFAGNRNSVNLDDVDATPVQEDRRHHKVRLGETLQSIAVHDESMKDVNMWVLICRVNNLDTAVDVVGRPRAQINRGDVILLPNQSDIEEFKLLNKLMEIAHLAGKQLDIDLSRRPAPAAQAKASPHCRVDRQMSIEKLWDRCRMILTDNDDTSYSIKLQRDTMEGKWATVASYESTGGKTLRWTYKIDGAKNCLEVGLPAAVSREMAIEDFQRNWRFYYNRYTAIKTDTLELLDLSEVANH